MTLLSPSNRNKIKNAIKSVTDTFFKEPIVYKRRGVSMDRFGENNQEREEQIYNLEAFVRFDSGSTSGRPGNEHTDGGGTIDDGDGYILFHIEDLRTAGLIDINDNFIGWSNTDIVIYQNETLYIKVPTLMAQLVDENLLVKVSFRRKEKNG